VDIALILHFLRNGAVFHLQLRPDMVHKQMITLLVIYFGMNANAQTALEPAPTSEVAEKATEIAAVLNPIPTPPMPPSTSSPSSADDPIRFCGWDQDCTINSVKKRCLTDNSIGLCVECITIEDCEANAQKGQELKCRENIYICEYNPPYSNGKPSPVSPSPSNPPVGPPPLTIDNDNSADNSSLEYEYEYYYYGDYINPNYNEPTTTVVVGLSVGLGCLLLLVSSVLGVFCFRRHQKKKMKMKKNEKPFRGIYESDEHFFKECDEGLKDLDSLLVVLSSKSSKERDLHIEGSSSWSIKTKTNSGTHRVVHFDELKPKSKLGSGSYGLVYLADWDQTSVAVKILTEKTFGNTFSSLIVHDSEEISAVSRVNPLVDAMVDAMMQEAELMASLRHPNVVQFLAVCLLPPAIVTEWCVRGSLFGVLQASNNDKELARQLTWGRRLSMAFDAAKGMLYLHNNRPVPVIHRDLKSPNLLVATDWTIKVADFNLSRLAEEHAADRTDFIGGSRLTGGSSGVTATGPSQPRWLAPECMRNEPFTAASDVFSFAVVMWELLTGNIPWGDVPKYREETIFTFIQEGKRLDIPPLKDLPGFDGNGGMDSSQVEQYIKLMERCWANDPGERPLFDEIAVVLGEMKIEFIRGRMAK
jgi:hypothetical protein